MGLRAKGTFFSFTVDESCCTGRSATGRTLGMGRSSSCCSFLGRVPLSSGAVLTSRGTSVFAGHFRFVTPLRGTCSSRIRKSIRVPFACPRGPLLAFLGRGKIGLGTRRRTVERGRRGLTKRRVGVALTRLRRSSEGADTLFGRRRGLMGRCVSCVGGRGPSRGRGSRRRRSETDVAVRRGCRRGGGTVVTQLYGAPGPLL